MAGRPARPEIDRIDVAELDQKLALDLADFEAAQVALAEATDQQEQALQARQAAQRGVDQAQSQWDTITQALSQTAEEDSLDLPRVLDGISISPEHAEALSSALGPWLRHQISRSIKQGKQGSMCSPGGFLGAPHGHDRGPSGRICSGHSSDGIHCRPANSL